MQSKNHLLIVILLLVNLAQAQTVGVSFKTVIGPKMEEKERRSAGAFINTDAAGNIYYIKSNINSAYKTIYSLDKLDKGLKLVQSKPLSLETHAKNKLAIFLDIFRNKSNGRTYLIGIDESGATAAVSPLEIKTADLSVANSGKLLDNAPKTGGQHWVHRDLLVSPDSTTFAYLTRVSDDAFDGRSGAGASYHVAIFNDELNVKWSGDIKLPFNKGEAAIKEVCLSNDGQLSFLALTSVGKKLSNDLPTYMDYTNLQWKLLTVKNGDVKTTDLNIKEGNISIARLLAGKNNVIVTGFYGKGRGENVQGVFVLNVITGAIGEVKQSTSPLPENFLVKKLKTEDMRIEWPWWSWNMSNVLTLEDGTMAWTAEQRYKAGAGDATYYRDLNAIVVYINKDISIDKVLQFPKEQCYNGNFVSVPTAPFVYKNNFYLLYLDKAENANRNTNGTIKVWNEIKRDMACVMLGKMERDGTFTKGVVVAENADNEMLNAETITPVGNGSYLFWEPSNAFHRRSYAFKIDLGQ